MYFEKFGIETAQKFGLLHVNLPTKPQMLATWFSYNDPSELVKAVFQVPLGCPIIYGVQTTIENGRIMMLLSTLMVPFDNADDYNENIPGNGRASLTIDDFNFIGGPFVSFI